MCVSFQLDIQTQSVQYRYQTFAYRFNVLNHFGQCKKSVEVLVGFHCIDYDNETYIWSKNQNGPSYKQSVTFEANTYRKIVAEKSSSNVLHII